MRPLPLVLAASALAGCAHHEAPPQSVSKVEANEPATSIMDVAPPRQEERPVAAVVPQTEMAPTILYVAVPEPLPLPGQLKPLPPEGRASSESTNARIRIDNANARARIEPTRAGWVNAVQVYPFTEGALYQVYAAPGQVTDIALEPGEQLAGVGPVAAGDTVRWIIGDTVSGAGETARVHILLKPTRADLQTNLVINTDRRTYHLELRASERTYMASVSWTYPADQLMALRRAATATPSEAIAVGFASVLDSLNFGYRVEGDRPAWRPLRAFDDGRQVMIEFPASIAQGEMPPIWVLGPRREAQLVNFRVRGRFMVVDRLFDIAELRLGARHQQKVRIVRDRSGTDD